MTNPFVHRSAAERYAMSRRRVHGTALRTFFEASDSPGGFHEALDVACGTGQSATALAEVSTTVVGVDVSLPMIWEIAWRFP